MSKPAFFDLHPDRCQESLTMGGRKVRCTARADEEGHRHHWDSSEHRDWVRGPLLHIIVQPRRRVR